MITRAEITEIGTSNKPHGIQGEISASFLCDFDEIELLSCIIVDEDGIFVPFFIESARPKSTAVALVKFDGIDSDAQVRHFTGKTIFALKSDIADDDPDADDSEADAFSFIGYTMADTSHGVIGEIVDIDDSTENFLFIVESSDGSQVLVPIADEFIHEIDDHSHRIVMNLPEGIINLNNSNIIS